jgi:hypothetical protein
LALRCDELVCSELNGTYRIAQAVEYVMVDWRAGLVASARKRDRPGLDRTNDRSIMGP